MEGMAIFAVIAESAIDQAILALMVLMVAVAGMAWMWPWRKH